MSSSIRVARLAEQESIESAAVPLRHLLDPRQEHESDAEKNREDDPDGGVLLDPAPPDDQKDEQRPDAAGDHRADQKGQRVLATGDEERDTHPGQSGVRERIAEQTLPPEERERAHDAADHSEERGAEQHDPGGVTQAEHDGDRAGRSMGFKGKGFSVRAASRSRTSAAVGSLREESLGRLRQRGQAPSVGLLYVFFREGGRDRPPPPRGAC